MLNYYKFTIWIILIGPIWGLEQILTYDNAGDTKEVTIIEDMKIEEEYLVNWEKIVHNLALLSNLHI